MNADEAYRRFGEGGEFPKEALQWALENWEAAAPRFLAKLRAGASGAPMDASDLDALFYIVHLCGEKCEERAYVPICRIVATDEALGVWLGDALFETLPGILINVCDGDVEPLKEAILSDKGDEFAREAPLIALAYLVRARGVMTDESMRALLRELILRLPQETHPIWEGWVRAVAWLGYDDMKVEVARVCTRRFVDREEMILEDFYSDLALARRDVDGLAAFHDAGVKPFASTIETLGEWSIEPIGEDLDAFDDGEAPSSGAPVVNPFRDVGRNDPCPCGSGKKYKKCCLAA